MHRRCLNATVTDLSECPECGMAFDVNFAEDRKFHQAWHEKKKRKLSRQKNIGIAEGPKDISKVLKRMKDHNLNDSLDLPPLKYLVWTMRPSAFLGIIDSSQANKRGTQWYTYTQGNLTTLDNITGIDVYIRYYWIDDSIVNKFSYFEFLYSYWCRRYNKGGKKAFHLECVELLEPPRPILVYE